MDLPIYTFTREKSDKHDGTIRCYLETTQRTEILGHSNAVGISIYNRTIESNKLLQKIR